MSSQNKIIIYTDGAARGNPGPGGYGIVMLFGDKQKRLSAGYKNTTNNRMELLAVIVALQQLKTNEYPIEIYTDSQYVVNSIEKKWVDNWIKTDFKGGKKNKDLWTKFYHLAKNFSIRMFWVKGHASNTFNNICDELATQAADGKDLLEDVGYEGNKDSLFQ